MQSGLPSYDAARFLGVRPPVGNVIVREAMSTLRQRTDIVSEGGPPRLSATVPAVDRHVLVLNRKGAGRLVGVVDDRSYSAWRQSGQITLIPAGMESQWRADGGAAQDLLHVHLAPAMFDADDQPAPSLRPAVAETAPQLQRLLEDLAAAVEDGPPPQLYWDAVVRYVAASVVAAQKRRPAVAVRGGLAPWQVKRATDYIRARFREDVTLDELAALVRLSPFHFARAFKASVGMAPHRYLMARRLEAAQAMLRDSDAPVSEIALSVGYESPQALSRLFMKSLGTSPSAWRRAAE